MWFSLQAFTIHSNTPISVKHKLNNSKIYEGSLLTFSGSIDNGPRKRLSNVSDVPDSRGTMTFNLPRSMHWIFGLDHKANYCCYSLLQLNEGDAVHLSLSPQSSGNLAHLFFPVFKPQHYAHSLPDRLCSMPGFPLLFFWIDSHYRPCLFLTCLTCLCLGKLLFFGWLGLCLLLACFPSTWFFQSWIYSLHGLSKTGLIACGELLWGLLFLGINFTFCFKLSLCSIKLSIKYTSAVCVLHLGPALTFALSDFLVCSGIMKNSRGQLRSKAVALEGHSHQWFTVAVLNDEMLHAVQGLCQILLLFAGCLTPRPLSHVIDG